MRSVHVLFFSVLRERIGCASVEMPLEETTSAAAFLDDLTATYPALKPYRSSIRMAVNQTYVDLDHLVEEGDEVALITPVSGG